MPNTASKPAFTLLELIVVITIISILVGVMVIDFRGARTRQELATLGDQSLALVQQAHAQVRAGSFTETEIPESDEVVRELQCIGLRFEVGELPQAAQTDYDTDTQDCNWSAVAFSEYGLSVGEAEVTAIEVGDAPLDELWALFVPPNGDIAFYDGSSHYVNSAIITFGHPSNDDLSLELQLSYLIPNFTLHGGNSEPQPTP